MFFTKEDYKKIEQYLLLNSKRDTDYKEAFTPLSGDEIITIVQDNSNRRIRIRDIFNFKDTNTLVGDLVNINSFSKESTGITLQQAIESIEANQRKEGQLITFLGKDNKWHIYQFTGYILQWNNPTLWVNIIDPNKDIIPADEEDITSKDSTLKLADKGFDLSKFSGLGRKYLRKHISEDNMFNILTQEDFDTPFTRYIIQYEYTLGNSSIIIPEGCILDFQGGSIVDGIIVGNKTKFVGIPDLDVILDGTFYHWGNKDNRPSNPIIGTNYFDTSLNKPIYYTGVYWVDSMGNEV